MPSIALQRHDVIVGVDTHKDEHIAVAIDGLGGLIDKPKLAAATPDGYAELLFWAQSLGEIHAFGVEGCGSYGSGLARFLRRHGHIVHEVARPPRKGERRLSGKSDPIDAEHAARTVLSGSGTATPKLANGQIEAVRVIKITRDTAVKARTAAIITLSRHSPDDIQIRGRRTTDPPPWELRTLRSPPMRRLWRADQVRNAIWQSIPPSRRTSPLISSAYAGTGLGRRSSIKLKIFWNKLLGTATSANWNVTYRP